MYPYHAKAGCLIQGNELDVCSWREWTWDNTTENDPGKRQGHSMVLYKSQVVIFGGRSDDDSKEHIPKTYKIRDVDGTLEFETYTDKQGTDVKERRLVHLINTVGMS